MNIKRAQIEVTSRCNFKCVTCKHGYNEYGEDLPTSICNSLIKEIIPGLDMLELQGTGESLLCDTTEKFIYAAAENGTEVTLITNGSLLTEEMMKLIISAGTQLVISFDGPDKETYSAHRPVGNFELIVQNIQRINEIRNSTSYTGFSIVVNMVLTQLNQNEIPNMIKLLGDIGVDFLFVSEVRECMPDSEVWNKVNLLSRSLEADFQSMISNCEKLARQKGIGFAFNPNVKPNGIKKKACEAPWNHIFVSSNGNVSVCCELTKSFGNLHQNSLSEILSNEALHAFQYNMLNGLYDPHCLNCCLAWGLPY